jgi:YD repeat-containing protein
MWNNYTSYDGNNRVTASNVQVAGQTYNFSYGYDLAGDLTSETYPSGRVLNTTFDIAARPTSMAAQGAATPYVQQVGYWPHGSIYYWQYGNNVWPVEGYTAQLAPWR